MIKGAFVKKWMATVMPLCVWEREREREREREEGHRWWC